MPLAEFGAGGSVSIAVINEARTPLGVDLDALVIALQTQVDRDFAPVWSCAGQLRIVGDARDAVPTDWLLVFLDDADQAGALGYHEVTDAGMPVMKVFVETTIKDGELVSVTASHEALEGLADPAINTLRSDASGLIYCQEVADPVQENTYEIDGIPVSDFVYPSWFEPFAHAPGTKFDHLGVVSKPFELAKGGYISILKRGRWTEVYGTERAAKPHRPRHKRHRLQVLGGKVLEV